ncbi:uncharacterized protein LOC120339885 [Styela clava]
MLNSVDPKFRPWHIIQKEFEKLYHEDPHPTDVARQRDPSLCLTHGFHHQKSFAFRDSIRCTAYRSNVLTDEFIVNSGFGNSNVLQLTPFRKDAQTEDTEHDTLKKHTGSKNEFNLSSIPPLQHLVWASKHRLFVGISSDKNMRVFSDTRNRCQILSAPTCCAMPVLSMVYLDETDEVVTGGIGVIQPWKIRFSNPRRKGTDKKSGAQEKKTATGKRTKQSSSKGRGGIPDTTHTEFGQGRQMLQPCHPYECDVMRNEWVLNMRIYNESNTRGSVAGGSRHVLVATSADVIVAIDYMTREQIWSVRLQSPLPFIIGDKTDKESVPEDDSAQNIHSNYVIKGHVSFTVCDFFPRFGYFITGGGEGMIQIMHMVNFGTVTTLLGHRLAVTGLVAHSKHPILISSSKDGSIRIWCLETFRENQRIDTCQLIENITLSDSSNSFFLHSKRKISLYYYHNLYSIYSIPHSTPATLCPISGDVSFSRQGRILAALSDGSVAILSPNTGLMLTMIYPMTTFQIFTDITFDIYSGMSYIKLQDGSILQCDCTSNPSVPLQRFVPAITFDEDVCSLASVRIKFRDKSTPVTAIIAGLCNGQIVLVRPNMIWMNNVQAHAGAVRFLLTTENVYTSKQEDFAHCDDQVFSVGASSIRIWKVLLKTDFFGQPPANRGKVTEFEFTLQPVTKVFLPGQCLHPVFVAAISDRLCLVREDSHIVIIEITRKSEPSPREEKEISYVSNAADKIQRYLIDEDEKKLDFSKLSRNERIAIEAALEKHRLSTYLTANQSVGNLLRMKERSNLIHTHNPEDDHKGRITALSSSPGLRFFASASVDGYVKIWDEMNRLLRELCFLPNPVTAISFVNGRDLLVALEGRIYAIECSTFLTRTLITERQIADLKFEDMANEAALKYDDDISVISKIENLPTIQLMGNMRQLVPDEMVEENIRRFMIADKYSSRRLDRSDVAIGLPSPKPLDYFDLLNATMPRKNDSTSDESKQVQEQHRAGTRTELWKDLFSKINEEIKRGSIAMFEDEEKIAEFLKKIEQNEIKHDDTDTRDFSTSKSDFSSGDTGGVNSMSELSKKEGNEKQDTNEEKQPKFPVAPDGYVPNSIVRKRVKPPPPPPEIQAEIFKLKEVATDNIHWATAAAAEASTATLNYEESTLSMMRTSIMLAGSDFDLENAESILQQYYMNQQKEEATDIDEDDDYSDFEKYSRQTTRSSGKDHTFRRLGNTLESPSEKERVVTFEQRKGKGRVPKYTSQVRGLYADSQNEEEEQTEDIVDPVVLLPAKESFSAMSRMMQETVAVEMQTVQPRKAPSTLRTKPDMKAKLLKTRTDKLKVKDVITIHPLLEEITKALWFRKKLSNVTAGTVTVALLEMGNTTRVVAHEKACENLTRLVRAFGPTGTDRGEFGNILSDDIIDRIELFIASYLTPRFSMTGVQSEEIKREIEESRKKNPNRVQLAHNALDAIDAGIGMSEEISCGILRLSADENEDIKKKAMKILTEKLNIDSWDKLASKLRSIVGDDVVMPPEAHSKNEKESLHSLLQRVKTGLFTLANAPRMAERLNLVISQRRQSVDDEESRSQTQYSSSISSNKVSSRKSSLPKDKNSEKTSSTSTFKTSSKNKDSTTGDDEHFVAAGDGESVSSEGSAGKTTRFRRDSNSAERKRNMRFQPKEARERKKFTVEKEEVIERPYEGGKPFTNYPKINWKKAIPEETKRTIKMMRTMKTVQTAVRMQRRRSSQNETRRISHHEPSNQSSTIGSTNSRSLDQTEKVSCDKISTRLSQTKRIPIPDNEVSRRATIHVKEGPKSEIELICEPIHVKKTSIFGSVDIPYSTASDSAEEHLSKKRSTKFSQESFDDTTISVMSQPSSQEANLSRSQYNVTTVNSRQNMAEEHARYTNAMSNAQLSVDMPETKDNQSPVVNVEYKPGRSEQYSTETISKNNSILASESLAKPQHISISQVSSEKESTLQNMPDTGVAENSSNESKCYLSDTTLTPTPPISASSHFAEDVSDSGNTAGFRLPMLPDKHHLSTMASLPDVNDIRQPASAIFSNRPLDSALGGSVSTNVLQSTDQDEEKCSTNAVSTKIHKYKKSSLVYQDSGYTYTDQRSTDVVSSDWRSSLKRLKQVKCSRKTNSGNQDNIKKRLTLPPIPKEIVGGGTLPKNVYATSPGERLATDYIVKSNDNEATKTNEKQTIICPLPGRHGAQTCSKYTAESRYGALAFRWVNQPARRVQHGGMVDSYKISSNKQSFKKELYTTCRNYTSRTCNEPYFCELRKRENMSVLFRDQDFGGPMPTPVANYRSMYWDDIMNARHFNAIEVRRQNPVSLYQIKSKSLKKLMKSARELSQKKLLKLPRIQTESVASGRRSITVRIPSCNSNAVSITPHDLAEY